MTKFWAVYIIRFVSLYFLSSVIVAAILYPGGNIFDTNQIGYSFTKNYLSDLGGFMSRSGEVNFLSSFIFNTSMFLYLLSGVGFLFVPELFKKEKNIYYLAWIGSFFFFIACFCFAGVGLTPHDLYQTLHGHFAKNAFRLLIPASIFYVIVLFKSNVNNKYTLVTLGYLFFTTAYVIYQLLIEDAMKSPEALMESVTIQKLIAIISTISIFSLTFAFSSKISKNNSI